MYFPTSFCVICFIYLFIVTFHFIFHISSTSLTYERHLPSNSCHLMAANVTSCLFFLYLLFSLVYFTYFILYVFASVMFPSPMLRFHLWHLPQTALFKGQWFLLYFSHIPSPSTPYLISFTFFHFCYVFSQHFPVPLSCAPLCFSLCTDPSNTTPLWAVGSLIAPDPVSCFTYLYSTVMYPYICFSFTLKMVATGFSETLVPICQTTPCHISEDYNLEF